LRVTFRCVTCGRPFPEGQGVIVSRGGLTLAFHSGRCAYRFFKLLFERVEERCVVGAARELVSELEKAQESRRARKRI